MGAACGKGFTHDDPQVAAQMKDEAEANKKIEGDLKNDKKTADLDLKLLLLGTGDSGKSTFTKQMAFIYGNKYDSGYFTDTFKPVLRDNCLDAIKQLLELMRPNETIYNSELAQKILNSSELTPDTAEAVTMLWANPKIKDALETGQSESFRGYVLLTFRCESDRSFASGVAGARYFLDNAVRFAAEPYVPTKEDILLARRKTVGICETHFEFNRSTITLVDVGGQRSERKKWFHCFSMVTAVIFLTAINEYDMVLEEDVKTNRLLESLTLWHALTCAPHFKSTPFILFLNKSDLFKQKIEKGPLSEVFLDFNEVTSAPEFANLSLYDKSWNYILRQFKSRFGGFKFFHHVTNVLDTKLCQKIFENVQQVIIELALSRVGL